MKKCNNSPLLKGKGDKKKCKNYKGMSLLSTPGKVFGRIIIEMVREITEMQIGDEQGGFRKGGGCVDQIFSLKCVCEKYLEKQEEMFVVFMYLESAYDRVDRQAMLEVLIMYRVCSKVVSATKSMYEERMVCVRIGRGLGDV
jgi:hypothetical protein